MWWHVACEQGHGGEGAVIITEAGKIPGKGRVCRGRGRIWKETIGTVASAVGQWEGVSEGAGLTHGCQAGHRRKLNFILHFPEVIGRFWGKQWHGLIYILLRAQERLAARVTVKPQDSSYDPGGWQSSLQTPGRMSDVSMAKRGNLKVWKGKEFIITVMYLSLNCFLVFCCLFKIYILPLACRSTNRVCWASLAHRLQLAALHWLFQVPSWARTTPHDLSTFVAWLKWIWRVCYLYLLGGMLWVGAPLFLGVGHFVCFYNDDILNCFLELWLALQIRMKMFSQGPAGLTEMRTEEGYGRKQSGHQLWQEHVINEYRVCGGWTRYLNYARSSVFLPTISSFPGQIVEFLFTLRKAEGTHFLAQWDASEIRGQNSTFHVSGDPVLQSLIANVFQIEDMELGNPWRLISDHNMPG